MGEKLSILGFRSGYLGKNGPLRECNLYECLCFLKKKCVNWTFGVLKTERCVFTVARFLLNLNVMWIMFIRCLFFFGCIELFINWNAF